jgi:hypothetical protein
LGFNRFLDDFEGSAAKKAGSEDADRMLDEFLDKKETKE